MRLLGVGSEKSQITLTFTLKETGDVVGIHQLIFGGKTNRCQPQNPVPANTYYDNTMSHWQTPATNITCLEKVVIPDRKATIARLNLPQNQWALVVHDLHYIKDAKVLEFMKENYLLSLYIPAGCTDVMQTCGRRTSLSKLGSKLLSGIIYSKNMPNGLLLILTARQEGSGIRSSLWVL